MKIIKENDSPLLSIIVPVYNVEKWLSACLDSIINQKYSDYEIIIVDDGSTDNSPLICEKYAQKHPFIKLIHKRNGGLTSARNAGLRIAKGKYIGYVDSDDLIVDGYFKEINTILNCYKDLDMIIFDFLNNSKKEYCFIYENSEGLCTKKHLEQFVYPEFKNFSLTSWRCIFKKELLLRHHCTDERISYAEDWAYTYECLLFSSKVYFLKEFLYLHNENNDSSIMNSTKWHDLYHNYIFLEYWTTHLLGHNKQTDIATSNMIVDKIWWLFHNSLYFEPYFKDKKFSSKYNNSIGKVFNLWKIIRINNNVLTFWVLVKPLKYSAIKSKSDKIKLFMLRNKLILSFIIINKIVLRNYHSFKWG